VFWIRLVAGVLLLLVGLTWIAQGLNIIKGAGMSGHGEWVVGGIVVLLFGAWLLWGIVRSRLSVTKA
jgi:hypothetical protein